jgi:hypothetical protein
MEVFVVEIVHTLISALIESGVPEAALSLFAFQAATGEITDARARALATVALGLISVIVGGLAWARGRGTGTGRIGSWAALVLGVIGVIVSALHIAGSTGFGTGGGRAGAIVALVLSLAGTLLGAIRVLPTSPGRQSQSAK